MCQLIEVAIAIVMCFCTYHDARGMIGHGKFVHQKMPSGKQDPHYMAKKANADHIAKLKSYIREIKKILDGEPLGASVFLDPNLEKAIGSLGQIRSLKTFGRNNYAAASASLQLATDLIGKQLISLKKIEKNGGNLKHPVEYRAALSMFQEMDTLVKATSADLKDKIGVSIVEKPDGNLKFGK
ncbi:hypothetical protein FACS1894122_05260 [Alphaproteobacteria bacterium]|nr:hypothetical protein FACS1894122_05260 [Alphaproteobacteria bacterium]